jgi:ABC-type sugar transport system ATPase subunit
VELDGRDLTGVPPRERGLSMVFQSYALYPHKTVFENIAYPLRVRGMAAAARERRVKEMAAMLQLERLLDRKPSQLSGGEAQRVAVARALVWQPALCLMDEPLSNLDALLRLKTRLELKRLHAELGKTFLFVTHDQEEALSLGTRIAVLQRGRLVQFATPSEIYHEPATRFVAEFIGKPAANTLEGVIEQGPRGASTGEAAPAAEASSELGDRRGERVFRAGALVIPLGRAAPDGLPDGAAVVLAIRPEAVEVHDAPCDGAIAMTIDVLDLVPPDVILSLKAGAITVLARRAEQATSLRPGAVVHVVFPPRALLFFDAASGDRILR